jgi:uroporphyrinogen decarboxylase
MATTRAAGGSATGGAGRGGTAEQMTPRERVRAAVAGQDLDRPPVGLWRHFPERDQTAADLAAATLDWQSRFGFDLVKFMPPGDYPTIDWGAESRFEGAPGGTRTTTRYPVARPADWATLRPVDVRQGFNGVVVEAVRQARAGLGPDVPLFQTIFSPLTVAMKLSRGMAIEHLRAHPTELHAALEVIAGVTGAMLDASIEAGADGIFFASQCADFRVMDEAEYREFGLAYDLRVLEPARDRALVMFHVHGEAPMFELAAHYPADLVQIVNWHDRRAAPHLADGQRLAHRTVAGGLNERSIVEAAPEAVAAEARDAIAQTAGRGLIVAPGCVIPVATPEANVRAAVDEARGARREARGE